MKPKRGCGCVVLVLALGNFFVLATLLYGMAAGTASVGVSLLMAALFAGNVAACVMLGLPAIRRIGVSTAGGMGDEEDTEKPAPEEEGEEL